jgi:DDE superfamily endonuclease/Tc5 transposase DNA-binding domain
MMSASAKETAVAAVKAAEGILEGIEARLKSCKEMVNQAKSGSSSASASLSACEHLQQRLLLDQCDAMVALEKARKNLASLMMETGISESTSQADLGKKQGRSSEAVAGKRQRTLAGFVLVKSADGRLRELGGPKLVTEDSDLRCGAPGCASEPFKSLQGLIEHQRWCGFHKSQLVSQQSIRELLDVKRSRVESVVVHRAANILSTGGVVDLSSDNILSMDRVVDLSSDNILSMDRVVDLSSDGNVEDVPNVEKDDRNKERANKVKGPQRGSDIRITYSTALKYRVARLVVAAASDLGKVKGACTLVADKTGISDRNVNRWYKCANLLYRKVLARKGKKGRGYRGMVTYNLTKRGPKPRFSAAEAVVLSKFERARENGVRVGPSLVKIWMQRALRELHPSDPSARAFKASSSWLQKFLARYNLVERRATNKKELSVTERLPKVQKWHKRWQRDISAGSEADPVFGKYLPCNIMNSDQVPFSIGDVMTTTYDKRGAKAVRISQQVGSDKRFCTLQICVSLDGKVQCKPALIFKGKGNIAQAERAAYDPRVDVFFQEKAWMDGDLFVQWVEGTLKEHVERLPTGPKVMILDNLRAQTGDSSGDALSNIGIDRRLLPAGVTDMIQPVDQNVGYDVKRSMIGILNERLVDDDDFLDRWLGKGVNPTYPAKDRRILITQLLGQAWEEFCERKDFLALGISSGCVMPKLGISRSHPRIGDRHISIKGIEDYSFEHADIELGEAIQPSGADVEDDLHELPTDSVAVNVPSIPVSAVSGNAAVTITTHNAGQKTTSMRDKARAAVVSTCELFAPTLESEAAAPPSSSILHDVNVYDHQLDDTESTDALQSPPSAPEGFCFADRPTALPPISAWIKRGVYWRSQLPDGENLGWIKAEIVGGPNDPTDAISGVTMRLKCDKRLDPSTPKCFQGKFACIVQVALTPENYGTRWFLLEKPRVA